MPKLSATQVEARRLDVLRAAMRCFARHGYGATTVRQIASEAGLAVGTFYLYFDDKRSAFSAIAEVNRTKTADLLEPLLAHEDPLVAIDELFGLSFDLVSSSKGRESLRLDLQLWAMAARDRELGEWTRQTVDVWVAALTTLVKRAQRRGLASRDVSATSCARDLFALLNGSLLELAVNPGSASRARKRSQAAIRRLLGQGGDRAARPGLSTVG